jgi:hypothetical protein
VLSARSEYFHAVFNNGMRESSQPEIVVSAATTPAIFRSMLLYLYTDRIEDISTQVRRVARVRQRLLLLLLLTSAPEQC